MKASLVLTILLISVGYSGTVLAEESCRIGSCRSDYENCLTAAAGTPAQCKMLYQASIKEGGVWGSPKARAASKTTGAEVYCHVDFE
jgi:hypothetical protein